MAAALAVPRPSEPRDVPEPLPDRRALSWTAEAEAELEAEARRVPLPFDVRAVGELLRRHQRALAAGRTGEGARLRVDLEQAAARALARHGARKLLGLRAVQTELFVAALADFEASGRRSPELDELAGTLLSTATESGWLEDRRLALSELERRVFFRIHWAELLGLRGKAPFAPTLDEWRVYYRFLLAHPQRSYPQSSEPERSHPQGRESSEQGPERQRLRYVSALGKRDSAYPVAFARGVLLYRLGAFGEAADAFRAHLELTPEGPYALRATNHLLAALANLESAE